MDWFERLTGFREESYEATRAKLSIEGGRLHSLVNGKSYGVGEFELASLQTLRERAVAVGGMPGRLKVNVVTGDVRQMHQASECAGALIQVASQFNVLEMTGPSVSPEEGVTRYEHDRTQGPACAIAAGAGTIYRNYFVPVAGGVGQTSTRQIDGLAGIGEALSRALGRSVETLWQMRNGYALCHQTGLELISAHLAKLGSDDLDALRARLRIGVQTEVEVTDAPAACFSGVLFGLACSLHASTRSLLASVRVAGAGSSLWSDDVECGPERKAWGVKYRAAGSRTDLGVRP